MNRRAASLQLAYRFPGGLEAVAALLGKRADTLRKELTGASGYKWGIDDEEQLIALCQAHSVADPLAPIAAAAVNAGAMLLQLPTVTEEAPTFSCLASAAREFAGFIGSIASADAHGAITARELKQIEREAADLVASTQQCVTHAHRLHLAGRPDLRAKLKRAA